MDPSVVPFRLPVDAVIFDCDGVLVDSDAAVVGAWRDWAVAWGLDPEHVLSSIHGRPARESVALLLPPAERAEATADIDDRELRQAGIVCAIPGAADLIASLPADRWAVVTSATLALYRARLVKTGLPEPVILVTADDILRGKPDPEGYRQALDRLRVTADRAVVFEDTPAGIAAALAAGVGFVVGVGPRAVGSAASVVVPGPAIRVVGRRTVRSGRRERGIVGVMTDRIASFRGLHASGCFVIPNPWDVGSARYLEMIGFRALATTSSGFAWSLGKSDTTVSLDEALAHLGAMAAAVDVPVNADFEGGFAVEPEGVAANVARAVTTGIAGISIEDSTGDAASPLFEFELAVARIRAARAAIDASGTGVLLTGRSEGFIAGRPDLAETIRRLTAYAEAGAECLYAPGLRSMADISAVVDAVAPKPVNVLVGSDFTTVAELAAAGVRRISVGGALARAAWTGFIASATEIAEHGTFTGLAAAVPFPEIDGRFGGS